MWAALLQGRGACRILLQLRHQQCHADRFKPCRESCFYNPLSFNKTFPSLFLYVIVKITYCSGGFRFLKENWKKNRKDWHIVASKEEESTLALTSYSKYWALPTSLTPDWQLPSFFCVPWCHHKKLCRWSLYWPAALLLFQPWDHNILPSSCLWALIDRPQCHSDMLLYSQVNHNSAPWSHNPSLLAHLGLRFWHPNCSCPRCATQLLPCTSALICHLL